MTLYTLGQLKDTCKRILVREKRPIHYSELARMCANEWNLPLSEKEMRDLATDVHEKGPQSRAHGMDYIGKPYCVAVLAEWFSDRPLLNTDSERVFLDEKIWIEAASEAMLRFPYILDKQNVGDEARAPVAARGFLIQTAVTSLLKSRWPGLHVEPDNYRVWNQWCGHDGKFRLPSYGLVTYDVAGANRYGEYGAVSNKPRADLNILAELDVTSAVITGVESGSRFCERRFVAEQAQSWSKLQAFLNMEAGPYGYRALADAFWRKLRKVA